MGRRRWISLVAARKFWHQCRLGIDFNRASYPACIERRPIRRGVFEFSGRPRLPTTQCSFHSRAGPLRDPRQRGPETVGSDPRFDLQGLTSRRGQQSDLVRWGIRSEGRSASDHVGLWHGVVRTLRPARFREKGQQHQVNNISPVRWPPEQRIPFSHSTPIAGFAALNIRCLFNRRQLADDIELLVWLRVQRYRDEFRPLSSVMRRDAVQPGFNSLSIS